MKHRRSDDRGSSLLFALVAIGVLSLVLASLLEFTAANLRATSQFRGQRRQLYSADGAVDGAINNIRGDVSKGVAGDTTCGYTPPAGTNGLSNITVTCVPTGTSGGVGAKNQPANAILTLASGASNTSEGLILGGGGSSAVMIRGSIFSNSLVSVDKVKITLDKGNITSRSSSNQDDCASTTDITMTNGGTRRCGYTLPDSAGQDPAYPPAASAPTSGPASPTCDVANGVFTFYPGLYTSPPSLPSNGNCKNADTMYFSPGQYYFNFSGSPVWTVGNTNVIGGTQANWSGGKPPAFRSATPACDPSNPAGVQFAFGGDSRLTFDNQQIRFELCASQSDSAQQIAIYQAGTSTMGYTPPPSGGCIRKIPYGSDGSCALMLLDANTNKPDVIIHGTIYAPLAAFDINVHNLNEGSFFDRGIVARSLKVDVSSSTDLTNPLFSISGQRSLREVVFTAIRDVGTAQQLTLLVADITFDDSNTGGTPGKTVTTKSWSVR